MAKKKAKKAMKGKMPPFMAKDVEVPKKGAMPMKAAKGKKRAKKSSKAKLEGVRF